MTRADPGLRHGRLQVGEVELHYAEAGSGPPVVLLHGFPEFWFSWRHQLRALASAGYRAIAPDLRGYNRSSKPDGVEAYALRRLVGDVDGLIRGLGYERAVVAGHDWGGAVAWQLAIDRPERVERLVIANAPHPAAFRRELRTPGQLGRSWYILFFQLPWLPELLLGAFDHALVVRVFRTDPVRPFTADELAQYREALGRSDLTGMINYYRAAVRGLLRSRAGPSADNADAGDVDGGRSDDAGDRDAGAPRPRVGLVAAPTLVIWGERDRYLGPRLLDGLERWVPDLRIERLPGASHWVQLDAPDRVSRLILDFLDG